VFIVDEEEKGSTCGKATKGAAKEEAGVPCKGKSVAKGEEVEESRRKRGGAHGQAMRSATRRVEEEFGSRVKKENRETLWQRGARESTPTGVRVVYKRSNSNIYAV